MKKFVSFLFCLMLVLGCLAMAEAEEFDPTANIWYVSYVSEKKEYATGEVQPYYTDYSMPTAGYSYLVLNSDGTGMRTAITAVDRQENNYPLTWTQPSAMQVQLDFESGDTWLLEYADGGLKRDYQWQSSEYADVAYTWYGTEFYTNDEDGAIRHAMQNYIGGPDDQWDPTATEEMLKRDMILTAFYDDSYRYIGIDRVLYQAMESLSWDPEKWYGRLMCLGDGWEIELDTKDKLFQYISFYAGGYDYEDGYIYFYIEVTTPDGDSGQIPVVVGKYEGRECYCVRLGYESNHFDFQAIPAEVIFPSYE